MRLTNGTKLHDRTLDAIRDINLASGDRDAVLQLLLRFARRFGLENVAMAHLVNPAIVPLKEGSWFNISNWPTEWYEKWRTEHLIAHDPIARLALRTTRPFRWSEAYQLASAAGQEILDESRAFGFTDGIAFPMHAINRPPGCVSFGGTYLELSPSDLSCLELVTMHTYTHLEDELATGTLDASVHLTKRETEILHWGAAGKTQKEIARALSISPFTVRDHLNNIREKYKALSLTHAVGIAISRGDIMPS